MRRAHLDRIRRRTCYSSDDKEAGRGYVYGILPSRLEAAELVEGCRLLIVHNRKKLEDGRDNLKWRKRLTEYASGLVELSPSDDGAKSSVADVGRGRRQTDRPDVIGEADRLLHSQDGDVVDKSRIDVSRMDEYVRNDADLFVRRQQVRTSA